jgi:hypothetical protein
MNVGLLFTVAMLLALAVGLAMSAGSLRRRERAIGYCTLFYSTFTERGPTGGALIREIGRQDVYLLCTNIKLPKGSVSGARGRAA